MIKELKGDRYWKSILIVIYALIAITCFLLYAYLNFVIVILGLTFSILAFTVRFKAIRVYNDRFEIVSNSMFNKFTKIEIYNYLDIKSIKFNPSYTRWFRLILGLYTRPIDRMSKSNTMDVLMNDNRIIEIIRMGDLADFINTVNEIIKAFELNKKNKK